jgi:hypothetical protein
MTKCTMTDYLRLEICTVMRQVYYNLRSHLDLSQGKQLNDKGVIDEKTLVRLVFTQHVPRL